MIFIIGAALLVVQLALEIIVSSPFNIDSFTPKTTVLIASNSDGAVRITFLAPANTCWFISSKVLYIPVDSITKSMSNDFQFKSLIYFIHPCHTWVGSASPWNDLNDQLWNYQMKIMGVQHHIFLHAASETSFQSSNPPSSRASNKEFHSSVLEKI